MMTIKQHTDREMSKVRPKKIVYLFGAGATHAELDLDSELEQKELKIHEWELREKELLAIIDGKPDQSELERLMRLVKELQGEVTRLKVALEVAAGVREADWGGWETEIDGLRASVKSSSLPSGAGKTPAPHWARHCSCSIDPWHSTIRSAGKPAF